MRKSTIRLLAGLAVAGGAVGAIGALLMKKDHSRRKREDEASSSNAWARPGMKVVFRAELMPGRDASERTFRVIKLLPSRRVTLEGAHGEHAEKEFEPLRRTKR